MVWSIQPPNDTTAPGLPTVSGIGRVKDGPPPLKFHLLSDQDVQGT